MKYIITALVSVLILIASFSSIFTVHSENNASIQLLDTFATSNVQIFNSTEFTTLKLSEASSRIITPHHPMLPKVTKQYLLPYGSQVKQVLFQPQTITLHSIQSPIIPNKEPVPLFRSNQAETPLQMDKTIYNQTTPYPAQQMNYNVFGGMKNNQQSTILTIDIYPIQYIPAEHVFYLTKEAEIIIEYLPPTQPLSYPSSHDLVIIGASLYQEPLNRLVDHKNNYDMKTYFKSTEEIYENYPGRDNAEQVKYFLKDAVETKGIRYVLLIGNIDTTPMRRAAINVFNDEDILTDLYYADLFNADGSFSTWDQNGNNKFCEYTGQYGLLEFVDLYSDIYVGRIPCTTIREVNTMVQKIITYETTAHDSNWAKKMFVLAGDTFPSNEILEGEIVTNIIATTMEKQGYNVQKLWTSKNTFTPLQINKEISQGAGFISYSGHGYEQGFGTSPPFEEQRIEYYSPYLIGMQNTDKCPVIFFDACSTTKLDFTVEELHEWYPKPLVRLFTLMAGIPYNMDVYYPTFSWQIIKKPHSGGIAAIGSTRVAFTGVDEDGAFWGAGYLNDLFFDAYQPGSTLGQLFLEAENAYLTDLGEIITLEEFILLGDPSLKIGGYP